MANTGYYTASAITQIWTSGPYSGSEVTKSISLPDNSLSGSTISYKIAFISGSDIPSGSAGHDENARNEISDCGPYYFTRTGYDDTICPTGECITPILTSVALSSSCASNYDFKYNVKYNSGSSSALFTKFQYSTTADFSSNTALSDYLDNSSPSIPPINISNLPQPPISGESTIYFRAFNSCSNAPFPHTSSYSDILKFSCLVVAPPVTKVTINNKGTTNLNMKSSVTRILLQDGTTYNLGDTIFQIPHQGTVTFVFRLGETISILLGQLSKTWITPWTVATGEPSPFKYDTQSYRLFNISGSQSQTYGNSIYKTITVNTKISNINVTPINTTDQICEDYLDSPYYTIFKPVGTYNPTFQTVFPSNALAFNNNFLLSSARRSEDCKIEINRGTWNDDIEIQYTITPYLTQSYQRLTPVELGCSKSTTCVLSGTLITLADGSTTPIDNLNEGYRVLSPSILTLPFNNDFDIFNWAVNELILTKGTAVITKNKRYQVSEVYSINNGMLVTTSTHNHLFKQNDTWNIKTTSHLMVGDYLSDKNGKEILIESIEIFTGEFTVFDLDVEENDLYIANGILTHNKFITLIPK